MGNSRGRRPRKLTFGAIIILDCVHDPVYRDHLVHALLEALDRGGGAGGGVPTARFATGSLRALFVAAVHVLAALGHVRALFCGVVRLLDLAVRRRVRGVRVAAGVRVVAAPHDVLPLGAALLGVAWM